jgi:peptidoglycan hydrolase-like protein with peptidoglycan-binding domain
MLKKVFFAVSISLILAVGTWAQGTSTNGTSTGTSKPAVFRPTKDQIRQGQTLLKDKKLYDGDATGVYNDPTRKALKAYQKENALDANGKFDKATLEKMGISLMSAETPKTTSAKATSGSSSSSKRPAPFRANAEQIKTAQKMLKDAKLYAGEQTGKLDDATREALRKYQEANGLRVMGSLNAATLDKMGIALTDAQKANVAAQAAYDAANKN